MTIDKRVIVITGTRKGIGKYLAEYYLDKGMIVCGCSRSANDVSDVNYTHFELDVADEKLVKHMVADVVKKYGRIDYLVNNAGIAAMNHSFLTPSSVVEKIFKTNVYGTFNFCREVAKVMAKKRFGRIVNFATIATPIKLEGECVYAASKAAVENMTKLLAKEYADFEITINAVGPTPILTDLIRNVPQRKMDSLLQMQAIHRFGSFEDVSNVIDFFIGERSDFITGQIIYLGGVSS